MESLLHQKISDKIKEIPEYLLEELSDFIDFLMIKKEKDWAKNLSENQIKNIQEGLEDIKNNNVFSHESVMEEMAEYISQKNDEGRLVRKSKEGVQKCN